MESIFVEHWVNSLVLAAWIALCAGQDARSGQVDHKLLYAPLIVAAAWLLGFGHSLLSGTLPDACLAVALTLILTLPGYARGLFGAADVKMLVVIALASTTLFVMSVIACAALLLGLWRLGAPYIWRNLSSRLKSRMAALSPTRTRVAYAPFLFVSVVAVLLVLPST